MISSGAIIRIPSPIDVHAHLREPGGTTEETIASGTLAAAAGGYQALFDMPNNPGGNETLTEERLDEKVKIARDTAYIDTGFYAGVNLEDPAFDEFPALTGKAAGLKLYMGHTTGNTVERDFDDAGQVIHEWILQSRRIGKRPPILLHAREEVGAETARYIAEARYPVHWCHISTATEVDAARTLSHDFPEHYTGGVTPHHLTMTQRNADFQQGWNGARMQPPLGSEVDADKLLDAYNRGHIQILETDHAPHTQFDKLRAEARNPEGDTEADCVTCFGVSGIEFVLPVMMSLVQRRKTSLERVVDSLRAQPMKMLGLKEDPNFSWTTELQIHPYTITEAHIIGKSSNTPYVGWTAWAQVVEEAMGRYRKGGVRGTGPGYSRILSNGMKI